MILDKRMTDITIFYPDVWTPKLVLDVKGTTHGREYRLCRFNGYTLMRFAILNDGTRINLSTHKGRVQ